MKEEQKFETPQQEINPELTADPPLNRKKWLNIALLALLGILIIASSVFVGIQIGTRQKIMSKPEQATLFPPTTVPTPLSNLVTDQTTNWRTYTNTINKYSVKIPQNWVVDDRKGVFVDIPGEVTFTPPSEMGIEAICRTVVAIMVMKTEQARYYLNTQQQFNDWLTKEVSSGKNERLFKIGNVTVDGVDAVQFVSRTLPGDATERFYSIVTWFRKDGANYYIELGGDEKKVEEFTPTYNQILTTFKFEGDGDG